MNVSLHKVHCPTRCGQSCKTLRTYCCCWGHPLFRNISCFFFIYWISMQMNLGSFIFRSIDFSSPDFWKFFCCYSIKTRCSMGLTPEYHVPLLLMAIQRQRCPFFLLCRLWSIAAHRDHFLRCLSVCLSVHPSMCMSSSRTFLVVTHSYVSQATHAFLGMLPLCFYAPGL